MADSFSLFGILITTGVILSVLGALAFMLVRPGPSWQVPVLRLWACINAAGALCFAVALKQGFPIPGLFSAAAVLVSAAVFFLLLPMSIYRGLLSAADPSRGGRIHAAATCLCAAGAVCILVYVAQGFV